MRERMSCFSQASASLALTCISHFSIEDSSHFHISTPPLFQPSFSSHFSPSPLLSYCPLQPLLSLGSHSFPILLQELTNSKLLKHALIIGHNNPQMRKLVVVHCLTVEMNMVLACPRLLLLQESTEILSKTIDSQRFCLESLLRSRLK